MLMPLSDLMAIEGEIDFDIVTTSHPLDSNHDGLRLQIQIGRLLPVAELDVI